MGIPGLPAIISEIAEIAEITDIDTAWKALDAFGGLKVYIPKNITLDHPLSQKLGFENARKIARIMGGCDYDFPIGNSMKSKKLAILNTTERNAQKVAKQLGCTERYVYQVWSLLDKEIDEAQASLFD
ncbi:MAG: hypothetical protein OXR68_03950 [Alphaproteobacteria bacterium]|nr:hypothetical protein [Alphaproteobacteria bacterium]MDD9919759.1 hypothetical protein [Alphaproteobacteria bacterium]